MYTQISLMLSRIFKVMTYVYILEYIVFDQWTHLQSTGETEQQGGGLDLALETLAV